MLHFQFILEFYVATGSTNFLLNCTGYSSQGGDEGFSWEVIVAITCGGVAFIVLVTVGTYFALK